MSALHRGAVDLLRGWVPPSDAQAALRQRYLDHLAAHPDGVLRDCHPDHLTASAVVVSADRRRVLLNLHGRYRRWMQFGGHLEEGDGGLAAGALREAVEESGIAGLALAGDAPAQLDLHEVRCGPIRPSHHLDVQFVAVAPDGAVARASDESVEVAWFDVGALPDGVEPAVASLVGLALRR